MAEVADVTFAAVTFLRTYYGMLDSVAMRRRLPEMYLPTCLVDWNGHRPGDRPVSAFLLQLVGVLPEKTTHTPVAITAQPVPTSDGVAMLVVAEGTAVYGPGGHVYTFLHRLVLRGGAGELKIATESFAWVAER